MHKINYELASLICLYESNERNIKELENHYKSHPYKNIKEEIIAYLNEQKDLLKKINNCCGFSKYYFNSLKVNKKHAKTSRQLKKINAHENKVINSKKSSKTTLKVATCALITSLLVGMGMNEGNSSVVKEILGKEMLTEETVEVPMTIYIGSQPQINFSTLELKNKHYDIKCPIELQDYFYELEEKWENIPASLAMLIVDQESDGQWTTNGVISPTNDYGLPQINEGNLGEIKKVLGYSSDDIKNDPYKSLDAMFYILNKFFNLYGYTKDNYDIENICGTYNGYIYWRNKEQSIDYVKECMERYNAKFADDRDTDKLLVQSKY